MLTGCLRFCSPCISVRDSLLVFLSASQACDSSFIRFLKETESLTQELTRCETVNEKSAEHLVFTWAAVCVFTLTSHNRDRL